MSIVQLEIIDQIAHVTLNRPEVHNAFDEHMIKALSDLWDDLAGRDDITAVILRGTGKSFSAGADLKWMKRAADYNVEQNRADALALATMLHKLYTLPKLTIAGVQGAAMGGGMGLVSCCDIVIAAADTKFALSEVKLGLIPATIAPYVLCAMGERHARRYFQTGEHFDGQKAFDIGFIHEIVADSATMDKAIEHVLSGIASNGPQAMAQSKRLCLDLAGRAITDDILADTAGRIAKTRSEDEAKEGLAAFLEKRTASWIKQ